MPSSHCASVISNKSICGTAPAMFTSSVDSAKAVERALDEGLGRARLAQIERVNQGFGAGGLDLRCSLVQFILLPRGQDNGFEIARQAYRGSAADALARAGDDGDGFIGMASFPHSLQRASPVPLPESRRRLHRAPYTSELWSTSCDRIFAPIRSAMKRCVSGEIMRSSSANRNHDGFVFHAGAGAFS